MKKLYSKVTSLLVLAMLAVGCGGGGSSTITVTLAPADGAKNQTASVSVKATFSAAVTAPTAGWESVFTVKKAGGVNECNAYELDQTSTILTCLHDDFEGETEYTSSMLAFSNVIAASAKFTTAGTDSYSIGGVLTGLASSRNVVLQNNGGDNLTLTANGNFTFGTELNNGDAYAVTVKTAPTGQACKVTNGTGTVNTANVTNIAVACESRWLSGNFNMIYSPALVADFKVTLSDNGVGIASGKTASNYNISIAYTSGYATCAGSITAENTNIKCGGCSIAPNGDTVSFTACPIPDTGSTNITFSKLPIGDGSLTGTYALGDSLYTMQENANEGLSASDPAQVTIYYSKGYAACNAIVSGEDPEACSACAILEGGNRLNLTCPGVGEISLIKVATVAFTPLNGTSGVETDTLIKATFSKAVSAPEGGWDTVFTVKNAAGTGTNVCTGYAFNGPQTEVTCLHEALAEGAVYKADISDLDGVLDGSAEFTPLTASITSKDSPVSTTAGNTVTVSVQFSRVPEIEPTVTVAGGTAEAGACASSGLDHNYECEINSVAGCSTNVNYSVGIKLSTISMNGFAFNSLDDEFQWGNDILTDMIAADASKCWDKQETSGDIETVYNMDTEGINFIVSNGGGPYVELAKSFTFESDDNLAVSAKIMPAIQVPSTDGSESKLFFADPTQEARIGFQGGAISGVWV